MNQILNYILGGIAIVLLTLLLLSQCSNSKKNDKIVLLEKNLIECKNAPIKSDTIHDTIRIVEYKYIKPTPKPLPNDYAGVSSTTNTKCSNTTSTYYSETFKKEGIKIHWEALASCSNDSSIIEYIRFPEILVPKETIVQTKTVTEEKIVEVPAKIKSKFMIYGGAYANNLNTFPGIEAGIGYLHKQSWGLMVGPMYKDKTAYGSLKIFITF